MEEDGVLRYKSAGLGLLLEGSGDILKYLSYIPASTIPHWDKMCLWHPQDWTLFIHQQQIKIGMRGEIFSPF